MNLTCEKLNLNPSEHKLYKTDWMEEPVTLLDKFEKSLKSNSIKQNDLLILRDNESPISSELMFF